MKPKHFKSSHDFSLYILDCAIRDRLSYLDAITQQEGYDIDAETKKVIRETHDEIRAMRERRIEAHK